MGDWRYPLITRGKMAIVTIIALHVMSGFQSFERCHGYCCRHYATRWLRGTRLQGTIILRSRPRSVLGTNGLAFLRCTKNGSKPSFDTCSHTAPNFFVARKSWMPAVEMAALLIMRPGMERNSGRLISVPPWTLQKKTHATPAMFR